MSDMNMNAGPNTGMSNGGQETLGAPAGGNQGMPDQQMQQAQGAPAQGQQNPNQSVPQGQQVQNVPNQGQQAGGQQVLGASDPQQGGAQGSNLQKDPDDWATGDEPMTEAQKSYLDTLAKEAGETLPATMTKAEASKHIDRLQGASGRVNEGGAPNA